VGAQVALEVEISLARTSSMARDLHKSSMVRVQGFPEVGPGFFFSDDLFCLYLTASRSLHLEPRSVVVAPFVEPQPGPLFGWFCSLRKKSIIVGGILNCWAKKKKKRNQSGPVKIQPAILKSTSRRDYSLPFFP